MKCKCDGIRHIHISFYLLYILLDVIMENFFITLENEENKVEELIILTKQSVDPIILEHSLKALEKKDQEYRNRSSMFFDIIGRKYDDKIVAES